jgi:cytochrome c oxidase subunit 3
MTVTRTLDVSALPPYSISNKAPLWWGQLLMAVIEASMFLMLIAIYFYARISLDVWPPPGTQLPHLLWPSLALVPLVMSAFGSYWAGEGAKENNRQKMLTGLIGNVVLGIVFLAFRFVEWRTLNFTWATDIHGSVFYSILFLHTLDAIGDLLYTVMLIAIIASGKYGQKQRLGVHVDSVLWYFIVLIWFPLYFTIYWGPYLVGAPR